MSYSKLTHGIGVECLQKTGACFSEHTNYQHSWYWLWLKV